MRAHSIQLSAAGGASRVGAAQPQEEGSLPRWLVLTMVFMHVLSNALIAQALPNALRLKLGGNLVRTATTLGRLGSCAALLDILITPQLGRLTDTVGRKPLLIIAPCVGCLCRAAAASRPETPFLIGVKVTQGVISATYMVALRAALADRFKSDLPTLTGRLGLVSAASGGAYAIGMLAGGQLVSRQLRYPYAVSALLLGALAALNTYAFNESLPRAQRVPFRPRIPALGFLRLFRSGRTLRGLSAVTALQQVSVSMGDTWQVFARELRGWGASQCGLFGSLTGLGGMVASLLVRSSVRLLGTRGHTLLATGCVVVTELCLGCIGSGSKAFVALAPNWIGRTQQMAVSARITNVGARKGLGQGALAGDRQNMHALIKVLCPTLYGSLFAFGCQCGTPALPFFFAAAVGTCAWLLVLLQPSSIWRDERAIGAADDGAGAEAGAAKDRKRI
jgi:DHA1 family tetracycline resistance protein-like MFS transporter